MADLVAWSEIRIGKHEAGADTGETTVIKPGETVTQGDLTDDQFTQLKESGAVKTLPYPDMPETYQDSPVNFLREQARQAADDAMLEVETSEENISAIALANAASTGVAMPEPVEEAPAPSQQKAASGSSDK